MDRSNHRRTAFDLPNNSKEQVPGPLCSSGGKRAESSADARESLHHHLKRSIEMEILPRLALAARDPHGAVQWFARQCEPQDAASISAGEERVDEFARLLLRAIETAEVAAYVDSARAGGLALDRIYLDLFARAARRLGEWWEADVCDFTEVTLGLGHLQQLLREYSPEFFADDQWVEPSHQILLVPAAGEQHIFGLLVVAEFFRRSGWGVWGGPTDDVRAFQKELAREWFDVVGFSLGSDSHIEALKADIASARRVSQNRGIVVLVGGPILLQRPELVKQLGADAMATDAAAAVREAERLTQSARSRNPT